MILIAVGANLPAFDGSPAHTSCEWAVNAMAKWPSLRIVGVSQWYESEPLPPSGQPPYVNGVIRLDGEADPATLLAALQNLEAARGRTRSVANAARVLDLDIIAMGDSVRTAPDPVLPHPRMHERAFVLRPLLDVAPGWIHPVLGVSARTLLERLPPQHISPFSPPPLREGRLHLK